MKKKAISLIVALGMTLSMVACGSSASATQEAAPGETAAATSEAATDTAETATTETADEAASTTEESADTAIETVKEGTLTVATSPDFAPYEFYAIGEDGTPELAGFDMALAQYIADYLNLELEVVTVDFDGVLSELQTKSVDLGMAGLSPDPKRESIMDFSDLYYMGGQSLVTVKGNEGTYNSFEAINKPEVSVGAQTGSIQLDLANTNSPDADIISLPKVTDIISELLAGKMDAAYIETDVALSYQKNYPDLAVVMEVPYEMEGSAIGICKGNEALKAGVNEAIAAAKADGSLEKFVADANEQASGEKYEGLLDATGNVQ